MKNKSILLGFLLSVVIGVSYADSEQVSPSIKMHKAITPAPKSDEKFVKRHALLLERTKQGPYDLIFLGDSITQGWESKGSRYGRRIMRNTSQRILGLGGMELKMFCGDLRMERWKVFSLR